jgi:MYXO-CTERM domain-containing protein
VDADEIWYDGVDQDCDTLSDYDADYDGQDSESYGGEDCDDADPDTYTGAPDTPYDGIITDCANADDYDADGDGDASIDYGGTDCDDANSDVYPGAEEIWYDGIDQDCDGNDDDQDEDGYALEDDCDDEDADSYPDNGVLDADCNPIEEGDTGGDGGTDKAGGCFLLGTISSSTTGSQPVGPWALLLAGLLFFRRRND